MGVTMKALVKIMSLNLILLVIFNLSGFQGAKVIAQSTSSSSGGTSIVLSNSLTGIWKGRVDKTVIVNGVVVKENSRAITLRICVKDGIIKGIVVHPGFFTRALITSQTTISENKVEVGFKDRKGRQGTLTLTLVNEGQLNGLFSNNVEFESIRVSPFRLCEAFRRCDINELFNKKGFED